MTADLARLQVLQRRLAARADVAPPAGWLTVRLGQHAIGVTSPEVGRFLAARQARCTVRDGVLQLAADGMDFRTRSALLAEIAQRLHEAGLLAGWRDEPLEVRPLGGGEALATIERAACRTLGIATSAVHMNAFTPQGALWVARRADHKAVDPGLWDNLVGGMVAAGETELQALAREAREEAGLDLAALALQRGGVVLERRPVPEGYLIERVQVFDTEIPAGVVPRNEDGEVAVIECWDAAAVVDEIERDGFTLEAALTTLDALLRRA